MSSGNTYHIARSFVSGIHISGENNQECRKVHEPVNSASFGNLKVGTISDNRIVFSSTINGKDLAKEAVLELDKGVIEYLSKIVFVSQGSVEINCATVFYKQGMDYAVLALPFYGSKGHEFYASDSMEIINRLTKSGVPDEFFKYWKDASMINSYPGKILLMCSGLEALAKNEDGKGSEEKMSKKEKREKEHEEKHEKLKEILGEELRYKLFGGGKKALRNRLAHGNYYDTEKDIKDVRWEDIHWRVIQYFHNNFLKGIKDIQHYFPVDHTEPHGSSRSIVEGNFLKLKSRNQKFDVINILQDLEVWASSSYKCFSGKSPYYVDQVYSDNTVFNDY